MVQSICIEETLRCSTVDTLLIHTQIQIETAHERVCLPLDKQLIA